MTPLQTTVLMKTDIAGSTPKFRELLTADLQAVLADHRAFVAHHATSQNGRIVRAEGDGFWLVFPSVTGAAKAAIAMQDALSLAQSNKGDDRLSMRVVIGLGDVALQEGDLVGETLALIVRIEAITPSDEIYLTAASRLALNSAEIQTSLVDSFSLQGFSERIPVHRIEQRHHTRIFSDAYILVSDLRAFSWLSKSLSVDAIERLLDSLDALTQTVANEFGGTVLFKAGDGYYVTFPDALQVMAAAARLCHEWDGLSRGEWLGCGLNIAVHRGQINAYRSFLYGDGFGVVTRVSTTAIQVLRDREGGVFITSTVRDDLTGSPWHDRLEPVSVAAELEIYCLDGSRSHEQQVVPNSKE